MAEILFEHVTKQYQDRMVLNDLTLQFPEEGFVCITGPSGIGKTTVFNLLLGLEKCDAGTIRLQKSGKECMMSVVFQEDRLLPGETVLENVLAPVFSTVLRKKSDGYPSDADLREKAVRILSELGLKEELNTLPSQLSGGMARRVSIARALTFEADLYLMDEPTKGLDEQNKKNTLEVIRRYTDLYSGRTQNSLRPLLIMITHDPKETEGAYVIHL